MTPSSLLHLPVELICHILSCLTVHDLLICSQLAKPLRKIIHDSSRLQYTIDLDKHRVVDLLPSTASPPFASRLRLLRDREKAWRSIKWNAIHTLNLPPTGSVYEFVGGLYGNGREDESRLTASISFLELPTAPGGVAAPADGGDAQGELRMWTHPMADVTIIDFTMDPSQDLLVLVALAPPDSKYLYDLHLRSISTNQIHPKATLAVLPCLLRPHNHPTPVEVIAAVRVQVAGDLVALLIKEVWESSGAHLEIWNWEHGPQYSCAISRISGIDDFTFLSHDTFLLVRPIGRFEVYHFSDPRNGCTKPELRAAYDFPPLAEGYMYWYISMSSNPAPGYVPKTTTPSNSKTNLNPPFSSTSHQNPPTPPTQKQIYYPRPDERIHACCLYIFNPSAEEDHAVRSFVFFLNIRTLLEPPAEWGERVRRGRADGRGRGWMGEDGSLRRTGTSERGRVWDEVVGRGSGGEESDETSSNSSSSSSTVSFSSSSSGSSTRATTGSSVSSSPRRGLSAASSHAHTASSSTGAGRGYPHFPTFHPAPSVAPGVGIGSHTHTSHSHPYPVGHMHSHIFLSTSTPELTSSSATSASSTSTPSTAHPSAIRHVQTPTHTNPASIPIPWDVWGPQSTRWFEECLSTDWQHAIYGLRTVESVSLAEVWRERKRGCRQWEMKGADGDADVEMVDHPPAASVHHRHEVRDLYEYARVVSGAAPDGGFEDSSSSSSLLANDGSVSGSVDADSNDSNSNAASTTLNGAATAIAASFTAERESRRFLRIRDFNPYSITHATRLDALEKQQQRQRQRQRQRQLDSESSPASVKGKQKALFPPSSSYPCTTTTAAASSTWRTPRIVTGKSITPSHGVFKKDIESWLPYTEVVSEEKFDVTDVMMDDCRLLLLKRGKGGKLKRVDVLTM